MLYHIVKQKTEITALSITNMEEKKNNALFIVDVENKAVLTASGHLDHCCLHCRYIESPLSY